MTEERIEAGETLRLADAYARAQALLGLGARSRAGLTGSMSPDGGVAG